MVKKGFNAHTTMENSSSESGIIIPEDQYINTEFTDLELLGSRGFNTIIKARRNGRLWLLKGLAEPFRGSGTHIRLLHKEFEILSRMQHPGVVMAVGIEEVDGVGMCIVMEWVDGVTLKEWISPEFNKGGVPAVEGVAAVEADSSTVGDKQTGRSLAERLRIAFQIMDALEYVHSRQAAHRDLKPSNIMITRNGAHVKLIDFGLADTDDYAVYKQPAGTVGYMSPEQAEARVCDIRNDIYSLGCVLENLGLGRRYARIVRRCKAESGKRFNNINEVRRAFRFSSSVRKGLVLAASVSAALLCGYLLNNIQTRRISSELETLRSEREAAMQENLAHDAEIAEAIAEGKRLMDETMSSIDLNNINTWEEASLIQYETAQKLSAIWESFPRTLGPEFTDMERENIKSVLASHWSDIMTPLTQRVEELSGRSRMQKQP